jgi:hypothetical protein
MLSDTLFSKCAKIRLRLCLEFGVCAKERTRHFFSFVLQYFHIHNAINGTNKMLSLLFHRLIKVASIVEKAYNPRWQIKE